MQLSSFSEWDKIHSPSKDQIVDYNTLPATTDASVLNKVRVSLLHDTYGLISDHPAIQIAVLKLNGGLGTSMGMYVKFCAWPWPHY